VHYAWAVAAGLVVVAPDLVYNLTATQPDYHYVNYLDHLNRVGRPALRLHGLGFFLKDVFNVVFEGRTWIWADQRCDIVGPGIVMGLVLLAGWLHSFRKDGDPTRGLWSAPTLLFLLVVTFTRPLRPTVLDEASWTWPAPTIGLVTAGAALLLVRYGRYAWPVYPVLLYLMSRPGPSVAPPCI
jgi:hypothetical protein